MDRAEVTNARQKDAYREGFQDGRDGLDKRDTYPWALVYFYLAGRDDARVFFSGGN